MDLVNVLSWIGMILSVSTSITRAANIGYQAYSYIFSAISCVLLAYNGYVLGSTQMIILYIFHLLINLVGIYRWSKKDKNNKKIIK